MIAKEVLVNGAQNAQGSVENIPPRFGNHNIDTGPFIIDEYTKCNNVELGSHFSYRKILVITFNSSTYCSAQVGPNGIESLNPASGQIRYCLATAYEH